jgi:signal transduction histidine kinase
MRWRPLAGRPLARDLLAGRPLARAPLARAPLAPAPLARAPLARRPLAWLLVPVALGLTALALGAVSLASLHAQLGAPAAPLHSPLSLGRTLVAVAVVAPLLLAARRPLLGWWAGWLALLLAPLVPGPWWGGWPWGPAQVVVLVMLFCAAGLRYRRPVLWAMWALSLIPWWLWLATDLANLRGPAAATVAFTLGAVALDSIGVRLRTQQALVTQTERTELEHAQRAMLEERTRIARELHDVVAHHMSLVAVRAETAPFRLGGLPEPAAAEFSALAGAAREALADMRQLLGVLRQDRAAERAPQPGLADLPALVDAARRAGNRVELSLPPVLDQVPAGVAVCAYRIVQESLSNAGQHAPGAPVTVSVSRPAGAVLLRVASGPARPPAAPGRPGHGLTGMRERVALLGGSLSAGPEPDGCFVVSAVLPAGEAA